MCNATTPMHGACTSARAELQQPLLLERDRTSQERRARKPRHTLAMGTSPQAGWLLPGWLCSWRHRSCHRCPSRSWWDKHICAPRPARGGRGCCSLRCWSCRGGWELGRWQGENCKSDQGGGPEWCTTPEL